MNRRIQTILLCFIPFVLFGVDRLIKYNIEKLPVGTVFLDTCWLCIIHVRNPGVAFGFLSRSRTMIVLVTGLLIVGIAFYAYKRLCQQRIVTLETISILLLLGGALGNVYDRLTEGTVIDYLQLHCISFPVFNFADVCVTVGCLLLMMTILLRE